MFIALKFYKFGGCKATFLKLQQWYLAWGCGPGTPRAKFCESRWRGYTTSGKIYTKNYQFWGCKSTFLKPQWWDLTWRCVTRSPSFMPNFVKKSIFWRFWWT